jgi:hypothetical protein
MEQEQFERLMRLALKTKSAAADLSSALGEKVKDAAEKLNLHRAAWSHTLKLTRMSAEKREMFLRAADKYAIMAQHAGLWEVYTGDIEEMANGAAEPAKDERVAEEIRDWNVAAIRKGIKLELTGERK